MKLSILLLPFLFFVQWTFAQEKAETPIYTIVEDMPKFGGATTDEESNKALMNYLGDHLIFPLNEMKNGKEGIVYVQITIDQNGEVTHSKVVRSPGTPFTTEAMQLIKILPKWRPGMQRGKAVRVNYMFPIRFTIKEHKAKNKGITFAQQQVQIGNRSFKFLEPEDALKAYDKAIASEGNIEAYYRRGLIYLSQDNTEKACADFTICVANNHPGDAAKLMQDHCGQ